MAFLPILYRIQELDSQALALKRTLDQAAADPNILAVQTLQQQIVTSLGKIETQRQRINSAQRQLELDLKACQERLGHEEAKLYDGTVVSSRGLEQVQQKATEYRNQQAKIEDEKLAAEQSDLKKRLTACEAETAAIQQRLKQQSMEIALEQNQIDSELEELRPRVPVEWLERYQRIAKAHFGIGITKIKTDSCGACHVGLSDLLLGKAKQGEDTLIFCESCGRILYFS